MAVVASHLAPLGVVVGFEPGDLIVKDAAVLLAEVVTVEDRTGIRFVGLDAGWNVFCSWFIYRFAQELVLCRAADAPRTDAVTVIGHINEAGDIFVEDYLLPPIREGDVVALLNAGGYEQAMSMTHCLRPVASADFLDAPLMDVHALADFEPLAQAALSLEAFAYYGGGSWDERTCGRTRPPSPAASCDPGCSSTSPALILRRCGRQGLVARRFRAGRAPGPRPSRGRSRASPGRRS